MIDLKLNHKFLFIFLIHLLLQCFSLENEWIYNYQTKIDHNITFKTYPDGTFLLTEYLDYNNLNINLLHPNGTFVHLKDLDVPCPMNINCRTSLEPLGSNYILIINEWHDFDNESPYFDFLTINDITIVDWSWNILSKSNSFENLHIKLLLFSKNPFKENTYLFTAVLISNISNQIFNNVLLYIECEES